MCKLILDGVELKPMQGIFISSSNLLLKYFISDALGIKRFGKRSQKNTLPRNPIRFLISAHIKDKCMLL